MKMQNILFAVGNLEKSLDFYRQVLGLEIANNFGANVVLTGGLSLQTLDTWAAFLGKTPGDIRFGGDDAEIYFETEDFDAFLKTLEEFPEVELVRPPLEHGWGQRVVRLYDPDHHIIEVGESMARVCCRFLDSGLNEEGIARRMDVSVEYVREQLKGR